MFRYVFKHLILAGTFDHLHLGHQKFIQASINQSQSVSCGVASNWSKKDKVIPQAIQNFRTRVRVLKEFLLANQLLEKTHIFPLKNPYEPAASHPAIDAIAVTQDTLPGAKLVNLRRKQNHLPPLNILNINLLKADDHKRISSTRIRLGEINRQGLVYQRLLAKNKTLYLPLDQRRHFKKPLGQLLTGSKNNISWAGTKVWPTIKLQKSPFIITVGDITTQALWLNKLPINLAIYDYRCQRQPIFSNFHKHLKKQADFFSLVRNDPGTISWQTTFSLTKILPEIIKTGQKGIIQVKGEEDLLVLPVILLAPLGTFIFYGQPQKGLVQIKVTEKAKTKTLKLIQKFVS